MLHLKLATDPRWVDLAKMKLEDILTDHAYCEQKAASSCISLVQTYADNAEIVEEVSPIVTEEWGHFRQVLAELKKRGLSLGKQRKDEYVNKLLKFKTKGGTRKEQLLDNLLICALIEARSCERFRLLSEGLNEPDLREFYRKFMIAEAGHYKLFISLARKNCGIELTEKRWEDFLNYETSIMHELELRGDRMH
ncbi:MAG: tRNA-hydroxylase [Bacteroidota bacterium]|jgi:tRNA-(ms[2]io[6]A)-hydroxylase